MEEMLAMSREMAQTASQVFSQLDNVDLSFGTISDDTNGETELSHGNFTTFLQASRSRHTAQGPFSNITPPTKITKKHDCRRPGGSGQGRPFLCPQPETRHLPRGCPVRRRYPAWRSTITCWKLLKSNQDPLFTYLDFRRDALELEELHFL